MFLDGVVTMRASVPFVVDALRGRRLELGRYGVHALVVAVVIPVVWMTLGFVNGHNRSYVIADGNGVFFLVFTLVFVALLREGLGEWVRRWLFIACVVTATVTFVLIIVSILGVIPLEPTLREVLVDDLAVGNAVGYMPNGAYRLYLASGLYLQVGIALTVWRLLTTARHQPWLWALLAILLVDVAATYTRGLWAGAAVAFILVVAFGARRAHRVVAVCAAPVVLFLVIAATGTIFGFSAVDYIFQRAATVPTARPSAFASATTIDEATLELERGWHVLDSGDEGSVTTSASREQAKFGSYSRKVVNRAANEDDYLYQIAGMEPNTIYTISAWVSARELQQPASADRGLLAWDISEGATYTARLTDGSGWRRISVTLMTGSNGGPLQVRLYAPHGTIYWDQVRVVERRRRAAVTLTDPNPTRVAPVAVGPEGGRNTTADVAGEVSNQIRVEQAKTLWRHIRDRPVLGYGFGAVAPDYKYGSTYSYELTYLHLLYKTGLVGLLIFLSYPGRLLVDAVRARLGVLPLPAGVRRQEVSVVIGIIVSVLLVAAVNPYILAAFGLMPLLACIAWLDPVARADPTPRQSR